MPYTTKDIHQMTKQEMRAQIVRPSNPISNTGVEILEQMRDVLDGALRKLATYNCNLSQGKPNDKLEKSGPDTAVASTTSNKTTAYVAAAAMIPKSSAIPQSADLTREQAAAIRAIFEENLRRQQQQKAVAEDTNKITLEDGNQSSVANRPPRRTR